MLAPYWQSDDGSIRVYNARWEDVAAAGCIEWGGVALIHADPPYGVAERCDRKSKGRGKLAECNDFPQVDGDDAPFDPSPLLGIGRPTVLWGANHYASRLPDSPSWLLWDKRVDIPSNDNADGESAWTNLGGPLRIFRHVWNGMIKASERESRRMHPTQKPVALSTWVFGRAKLKRGDLVFVPYLGSGPDLPAARAMGLRVVACETVRAYCDAAIGRLGAVTAEHSRDAVGPLFAAADAR